MRIKGSVTPRRTKAMLAIEIKLTEYRDKFGCRAASRMKPEILDDVSETTDYDPKTLSRYYNDWVKKKGIFCHLK